MLTQDCSGFSVRGSKDDLVWEMRALCVPCEGWDLRRSDKIRESHPSQKTRRMGHPEAGGAMDRCRAVLKSRNSRGEGNFWHLNRVREELVLNRGRCSDEVSGGWL
jgi:hypothetical protein